MKSEGAPIQEGGRRARAREQPQRSGCAPHRDDDSISDKRRKRLGQQEIQINTGE
jgi:hypothetical protein